MFALAVVWNVRIWLTPGILEFLCTGGDIGRLEQEFCLGAVLEKYNQTEF